MSQMGKVIVIHKKRTCGTKYYLHQQKIEEGLIPPDTEEHTVRYIKLLTPDDRNSDITNRPIVNLKNKNLESAKNKYVDKISNITSGPSLPVNSKKSDSQIINKSSNYSGHLKPISEQHLSENVHSLPQLQTNMNPPTNVSRKRKRKKRNQRHKIIQSECFEPEIFLSDNINYGNKGQKAKQEETHYPMCPSPASTGSLTQSIFQYKDYKGKCTNLSQVERHVMPFNLSDNSNSALSDKHVQNTINLSDTSSNTMLRREKTTIILSDNTTSHSLLEQDKNDATSTEIQPLKQNLSHSENIQTLNIQVVDVYSDSASMGKESESASNESDSEASPSILDSYCTANDFTIIENNSKNLIKIQSLESRKDKEIKFNGIPKVNSVSTAKNLSLNILPVQESKQPQIQKTLKKLKTFQEQIGSNISSTNKVTSIPSTLEKKILYSQPNPNDRKNFESANELTFAPSSTRKLHSTPVKSLSQISNASSNEEYLSEESKICLGKVVKVMASHYDVPITKCVSVLKMNAFNILTTLQELQLAAISSSEVSEISSSLF